MAEYGTCHAHFLGSLFEINISLNFHPLSTSYFIPFQSVGGVLLIIWNFGHESPRPRDAVLWGDDL